MNEISRPQASSRAIGPRRGARRARARSGVFGVLDIGSTKTVCVIGRVESDGEPRAIGFDWQRSRGMKGGSIIEMDEAELAIRAAIAGAESMADTRIEGVIVNLSCGQPASRLHNIDWPIGGRAVTEADLRSILHEGARRSQAAGREVVHSFPGGFTVDDTPGVPDPEAMVCDRLLARLHVVDAASHALSNLGHTLHRCEVEAEEMIASPFASGLACLVEDERELGAVCVEMGGGTTSLAIFGEGMLLHTAQIPVGGWQVTNDLARVLSTPISHAERLKTMHGSVLESDEDRGEYLPVPMVGEEEDQIARVPRAMIVKIIRSRLLESFELLRDRLEHSGVPLEMRRRLVLTGGGSQLLGVRELASQVMGPEVTVRLGRPRGVRGMPEAWSGPAFATAAGLLAWAAGEGRPKLDLVPGAPPPQGVLRRAWSWLRERL